MGLAMPEQGLCMYQMDLEGHGYSGGERAYIEDYHHWVDDYRQVCGRDMLLMDVPEERESGSDDVFVRSSRTYGTIEGDLCVFVALSAGK